MFINQIVVQNKQLIIFDFCETLVKIQTADRFIDFINESKGKKHTVVDALIFLGRKSRIFAIGNKLYPKANIEKRIKLFSIRGITDFELNNLAKEYGKFLIEKLNSDIVEILKSHQQNSENTIMIVSGGYDVYINYVAEFLKIKNVIASKIDINLNYKTTGWMKGKDCMFDSKIKLLNQFLHQNKIDYNNTISYSDSMSDLPLLKWTNEGFVISKNKSQEWAKKNGLKEIIYHD